MFLDSDACGAAGSKSCGQEPGIFPSFLVPDLLIRGGTIAGFSLLPCAKGCHRPGQSPGPGPGHPAPGGPGAGVAEEGRAPSRGRRVPTEDQAGALCHAAPGGRELQAICRETVGLLFPAPEPLGFFLVWPLTHCMTLSLSVLQFPPPPLSKSDLSDSLSL